MASTASKKATTPRGAKTAVDRQFVTALARGLEGFELSRQRAASIAFIISAIQILCPSTS